MIGLFRRSCLANARQANHRLGAATSLSYCRFLISTGLPSESTKLLSSEEYINVTLPWPCDDPVPLAEFSPSFPPPDFCEIAVLFWAICCWSLSNCACVIPEDLLSCPSALPSWPSLLIRSYVAILSFSSTLYRPVNNCWTRVYLLTGLHSVHDSIFGCYRVLFKMCARQIRD
jgi:hypothetical protein